MSQLEPGYEVPSQPNTQDKHVFRDRFVSTLKAELSSQGSKAFLRVWETEADITVILTLRVDHMRNVRVSSQVSDIEFRFWRHPEIITRLIADAMLSDLESKHKAAVAQTGDYGV